MTARSEEQVEAGQCWRHLKRGTAYTVVGLAELQNGNVKGLREGSSLVVYRGEDGKLWAREQGEFTDGRFALDATRTPSIGAEQREDETPSWQLALDAQEAECRQLREALKGIHQARIRNGRDEGWGWDIGMLNLAMDVALPLIGQPRPERMPPEERAALRARFQKLLDDDRAALLQPNTSGGGGE